MTRTIPFRHFFTALALLLSCYTASAVSCQDTTITSSHIMCPGDSYLFHGQTVTTAGTTTVHIPRTGGCDSILVLNTTLYPIYADTNYVYICPRDSYNLHGTNVPAGFYPDTLSSVHGCDSIKVLAVFFFDTYNSNIITSTCSGRSYTFYGHSYSATGIYRDTFQTVHGCDSIFTLDLTVYSAYVDSFNASICSGTAYDFYGRQLRSPGVYVDTLQSVDGCDSFQVLTLSVYVAFSNTTNATICQGETYSFFGRSLTTSGTYYDTLSTITGCDSIIGVNLTVNPTYSSTRTASICDGDSYSFYGNTLTTSGTYSDTLPTVRGCDSIINLILTVNPVYHNTINGSICGGQAYDFAGQSLTVAGTYIDSAHTVAGCDSITTLILTDHPVYSNSTTATICQGQSYRQGSHSYTTAGTYTDSLQTMYGCDSVVTVTLSVNPTYSDTKFDTICGGSSYTFYSHTYTASGTYSDTLQTVNGCDSIEVLNLYVRTKPPVVWLLSNRTDTVICNNSGRPAIKLYGTVPAGGVYNGAFISADSLYIPAGLDTSVVLTYTITDGNGCTNSTSRRFRFTACQGIDEASANSMSLSPNPNKGSFTLQTINSINSDYQIYDVMGSLVAGGKVNADKQIITLTDAAAGIYTLVVKSDKQLSPIRFVISK